ncbi:MAG: GNAT family N-acetyltransferase [Pseudomonadota bacterium]
MTGNAILSDNGYYDVAPHKLATVVTSLEMLAKSNVVAKPPRLDVKLDAWAVVDPAAYRALYRHVGTEWLWSERLLLSDRHLAAIINDPCVNVYAVMYNDSACGLLELDYRETAVCEIAFFGLGRELIGQGVGGWLMAQALEIAWSRAIKRMWVHTCTLDYVGALGFYQSFGFKPFKQQVEIIDDPRLKGILPKTAASQVPMIHAC